MPIKGFSDSKHIRGYGAEQQYATVQKMQDDRVGVDMIQRAVFDVGTAAAVSINKNIVEIAGTTAKAGDLIQHVTSGDEFVVGSVSGDFISCFTDIPAAYAAQNFVLKRYVTFKVDKDGSTIVTVSSAPLEFLKDTVNTTVNEDTATPANSAPLPTKILDNAGLNVSERLPATVGQKARAASLATTLSTEDALLLTNILGSFTDGQLARAGALGVTLSVEDAAVQDAIKTAVESGGTSEVMLAITYTDAATSNITPAGVIVGTLPSAGKTIQVSSNAGDILVSVGGSNILVVLAGTSVKISQTLTTGDIVLKSATAATISGGSVAVNIMG